MALVPFPNNARTPAPDDDPDWDDLWQCHLELCRVERYLKMKENG